MTRTEVRELIRELRKYAIKLSVSNYRVILSGGNFEARNYYEDLIADNEEIEAMLILEYSKTAPDIRYDIEERASIDAGEDGDYNLLDATKAVMHWEREFEEWSLSHDAREE